MTPCELLCDYTAWRRQHGVSVIPRERFAEILDQLFKREMDGWQGIALANDVVPRDDTRFTFTAICGNTEIVCGKHHS